MRLLIVASYYWPEEAGTAPYVTDMAEYFARRGHHVDVATTFAHYPEWRSTANGRLGKSETVRGVNIRRRALYVPGRQSAAERALYEASMLLTGVTAILQRRRPHAVLGFVPSLAAGVLTAVAASLYRVPYGLIVHDLMGPGANQSGVRGGGRVAETVSALEGWLGRNAAAIAVIAEPFREYYESHGARSHNIHAVRTWTRRREATVGRVEARRRAGWSSNEFVCLHAGNIGQKQGLENLLEVAERLRQDDIRIAFVGDGNDRERLVASARDRGLANVTFLPMHGPGEYEALLAGADALLVNQRASVGDMSLPSKLTSYFAAGRPVLAAVARGSGTEAEIASAGGGVVVPAEDPDALAAAIRSLRADGHRAGEYARRGQEYARTVLNPDEILAGYERFAIRVATARDGRGGRLRR
jgi:colanic acid biosynthesis glycosyl transferase WcaI